MEALIGQPKENWTVVETSAEVHVIPVRGTVHDHSQTCWCYPRVEHYARSLVVHNEPN